MWKDRPGHLITVWLLAWLWLLTPAQGRAQRLAWEPAFARTDHQLTATPVSAPGLRVAPATDWLRPYSSSRLGMFEGFVSTIAGGASQEFAGISARKMTMVGAEFGFYGSLLDFILMARDVNRSRLRIGDYVRADAGIGLQYVRHAEVELEEMRPLLQTSELWMDLRAALGIQANLLLTDHIEIGGVAGKFLRMGSIWEAEWDSYSIPSLRGARLRYRNLAGEFQTATSPVRHVRYESLTYDVQDSYRTLRLRHNRGDNALLGILDLVGLDLEQWSHRLTKDGQPYVIRDHGPDTDATHSGTMLRFLVGFNH